MAYIHMFFPLVLMNRLNKTSLLFSYIVTSLFLKDPLGPTKDKYHPIDESFSSMPSLRIPYIAINRGRVYNHACRLSHDIQVISHSFINRKSRFTNDSFEFIN